MPDYSRYEFIKVEKAERVELEVETRERVPVSAA